MGYDRKAARKLKKDVLPGTIYNRDYKRRRAEADRTGRFETNFKHSNNYTASYCIILLEYMSVSLIRGHGVPGPTQLSRDTGISYGKCYNFRNKLFRKVALAIRFGYSVECLICRLHSEFKETIKIAERGYYYTNIRSIYRRNVQPSTKERISYREAQLEARRIFSPLRLPVHNVNAPPKEEA